MMGEKTAGYVTGYCRICHDLRVCRLLHKPRKQSPPLLVTRCLGCEHDTKTDMDAYAAVSPDEQRDALALMERTSPYLPILIEETATLDRAAVTGQMARPDRMRWMQNAFLDTAYLAPERLKITHLAVATIGMGLIPAVILFVSLTPSSAGRWHIGWATCLLQGLFWSCAFAAVFGIAAWRRRRTFVRGVERLLARALKPLQPTPEELHDLAAWARLAVPETAAHLDTKRLIQRIDATADTALLCLGPVDICALAAAARAELELKQRPRPAEDADAA